MLGTLSVVALWGGLLYFGLRLLSRLEPGSFERTVATTLLMQIVFQAALNIAVVTALVPPKGISHPLISCGGSNLVVSLVSLGVIVSLSNAPRRPVSDPVFEDRRTLVINRRTISLPPAAPLPAAARQPVEKPAKPPRKRAPKAPKPAVAEEPAAHAPEPVQVPVPEPEPTATQ